MTRRSIPPLALLCLSLAVPSAGLAADGEAEARKGSSAKA